MRTIWLIASGTFGDAIRRKILNVFLFVSIAMIVMGFAFSSFRPNEEMVIIKSLGLGVIQLSGIFISVILFINLIPMEIERRTIYMILSKPVQRHEFLLGKFIGGLMTVFCNIALMGVAFIGLLVFKQQWHFDTNVLAACKGILMIFFQLMLMGGLSMFISVILSPFVNFFLSFALYLLGSMSTVTESLAKEGDKKSPLTVFVFKIIHAVIPNFGNFNIQNPIIHPEVTVTNEKTYLIQIVLYAILYTAVFMLAAVYAFDRREV